jgi:DNA-binding XRE family transcriptional regulator
VYPPSEISGQAHTINHPDGGKLTNRRTSMPRKKQPQPLGKKLMTLRKRKKLTLKHLANETGLSTTYISQVEKAEVMPPVAVIIRL